jgi:hypothetical protein
MLRLGLIYYKMRFIAAGRNDSAPQDFSNDNGRLAGSIDMVVGQLIGSYTLGV